MTDRVPQITAVRSDDVSQKILPPPIGLAPSLSAIEWLAFSIAVGTLAVSVAIGWTYRRHLATLGTSLTTAVISGWTIAASVVFSQSTVQNLALASALAIDALAIVGITAHELSNEDVIVHSVEDTGRRESTLSAAA